MLFIFLIFLYGFGFVFGFLPGKFSTNNCFTSKFSNRALYHFWNIENVIFILDQKKSKWFCLEFDEFVSITIFLKHCVIKIANHFVIKIANHLVAFNQVLYNPAHLNSWLQTEKVCVTLLNTKKKYFMVLFYANFNSVKLV